MLGRGVPARAEVSFSKVASVYGGESIKYISSRLNARARTQFLMPATFNVWSIPQVCSTPARETGTTEV